MIDRKLSYEDCHKEIDGVLHKLCKICEEWFPSTQDNFYPKKTKEGLSPYCKKCESNKNHQWQVDNRERYNTYYKDNHSPKMRAYYRELSRKRRANGEIKKWQENNKDKLKQYGEKRQHKNHKISKQEWESCKEYFNNECAYCGLPLDKHFNMFAGEIKLTDFHKEHVLHEGNNDLSNCIPSCKLCNSSKHTERLEIWYAKDKEFFSQDRLDKIYQWLNTDYKLYIKEPKPNKA